MTSDLTEVLLTWLFWWSALSGIYCALLFGADALLAARDHRRQERECLRRDLAHLNDQVGVSVQRIGAALVVAQQLIRSEAAAERGDRR